ncbi:MAG: hypothetical protein ACK4ND_18895, partial [Cytophagaceae bacterium]
DVLIEEIGGLTGNASKLKEGGETGFEGKLGSGGYNGSNEVFGNPNSAHFWGSSENEAETSGVMITLGSSNDVTLGYNSKINAISVRCIKD